MDTPYSIPDMDHLAQEVRKMVLHNNNLPDTKEYVTNREVREICENPSGTNCPTTPGWSAHTPERTTSQWNTDP